MGAHAAEVEDHQKQSRAEKERTQHQREDAEQGAHRT